MKKSSEYNSGKKKIVKLTTNSVNQQVKTESSKTELLSGKKMS